MESTATAGSQRFTKIVVGTDFSANAASALDWGIVVAKAHHARIHLIHAIETASAKSLPVDLIEEVARNLSHVERTVGQSNVKASSEYRCGKPWEMIAEAEGEREPDLIVLGARGQTAYPRLFLGSTADRVLRTARAPVLTVHPQDSGKETAIKTVLVATDFSDEADLAAMAAARFLAALPDERKLVLLHAWQPHVQYEFPTAGGVETDQREGVEKQAQRALEAKAGRLQTGALKVEVMVRQGYPATVIEKEAESAGADLIALGTHGRSGLKRLLLGSIAERVLHHASCPVLTVRHPDAPAPPEASAA
ncbi:MAG: universal stress protein [Planctomycetota bacterium]|jgi:nucleotide-binding universal stress UspA family protein